MTILRRDLLLAFAANLGSAQGRGSIAFHYEAVFPPDAVTWYTRFETLVTGAVLAAGQMKQLRRNGSRLIAYEWSSGFYPGDTVSTAHHGSPLFITTKATTLFPAITSNHPCLWAALT